MTTRIVSLIVIVFVFAPATPDAAPPQAPQPVRESLAAYYDEHPPAPREQTVPRLIVVGIDGASWDLLDPLLARGELPVLASLKKRGRYGRLESTIVPESAMGWTTMRTGVPAGEHGVFSFRSRSPARPSYWRQLDALGLRSLLLAVPKVSARESVNGVIVEGWTAHRKSEYTHPRALKQALERASFDPGLVRTPSPAAYAARMRQRTDLLLSLARFEPWDHAFIVYEYGDTAGHKLGLGTRRWKWVQEAIDREIGRLLEAVGSDTTLLFVSDHGWKRYPARVNLNAWLAQEGFLTWRTSIYSGNSISVRFAGKNVNPTLKQASFLRIQEGLRSLKHPRTGETVVARLWTPAEAFPGPFADSAPFDFLVELKAPYFASNRKKPRRVFQDTPSEHHHRDGLYLLVGPGISPGPGRDATLLDVAPSILRFYGIASPEEMAGTSLDPFRGVQRAAEEQDSPIVIEPPTDSEFDQDLREKLRSLGYVE
ncbi:MAG: alkaline phosphatase family protein [Myxococcota bacterium]|jgi:predicted AlkP superfamily phosphohydrolase/phosphomutase|nr:alkaline phosphatase family protein [Myxococcota bacterium]HJO25178.1 alkaline phosphatase family protein [Myxococcota bacterium]